MKLERKLQGTLEAMSRVMRNPAMTQPRKSYILSVLEEQYQKLNNRYVKQFKVDYNPFRRVQE